MTRRSDPPTDMSLKAVHLVFVTAGVVTGILVIIYGVYFLKKLKKISYL